MNVWWCEEHKSDASHDKARCRLVEMQLVPLDTRIVGNKALVPNRIHGLIRTWNPDLNDYAVIKFAQEIADALNTETV